MVMWDDVFEMIRCDYPDVTTDKMLVDAMTTRMVLNPASIDTVVATNLHADVLSDLAAALSGSMESHRRPTSTPSDLSVYVRADPRLRLRHHG